jgi:hypothetical protein
MVVESEHRQRYELKRRAGNPYGDDFVPVDAPITAIHLEWGGAQVGDGASWLRWRSGLAQVDPTKPHDRLTQGAPHSPRRRRRRHSRSSPDRLLKRGDPSLPALASSPLARRPPRRAC